MVTPDGLTWPGPDDVIMPGALKGEKEVPLTRDGVVIGTAFVSQGPDGSLIVRPNIDPDQPPPCDDHLAIQRRDGNPPWCSACGWSDTVHYQPPRKIR